MKNWIFQIVNLKTKFSFRSLSRLHEALFDRTPHEVYESDQEYSTLILQKYPVRFNYDVTYIATLLSCNIVKEAL